MRTAIGFRELRPVSSIFSTLATLLAVIAVAGVAQAAPDRIVHETIQSGDVREVRTMTLTDRTESAPQEPASPVASTAWRGSILWRDQIHLNGTVQNVAISGDGSIVVGGWWLNNARVAVYDTPGSGVPAWTYPITTSFFVPVDASNDGSVVTATGRQDQLYAWNASSPIPYCAKSHPLGFQGALAMTPDPGGLFAGSSFLEGGDSEVQDHTDACGDLFSEPLTGRVQGGRFAAAGDWIAVNSRTVVNVYNATTGALRGSIAIPGETQAAPGISADGSIVAFGGFTRTTYVYGWTGTDYQFLWSHLVPTTTWITAVDVSDDGSTVMVGTVRLTTPEAGSVVMYDVATGPTPLWINQDFGDEVNSVALSADGSIGLAGSWGRINGTVGPIVAAFERTSNVPYFTVGDDELAGIGSCYAVDISNDGLLGCAGGKAVHAREFGSGGYMMAFSLELPIGVEPGGAIASGPTGGQMLVVQPNRPNPVRSGVGTEIPFTLGTSGNAALAIFDAAGRTVRVAELGVMNAGQHVIAWDGRDGHGRAVPGGAYFYAIEAGGSRDARRLVVTR